MTTTAAPTDGPGRSDTAQPALSRSGIVELFWIPLGAGQSVVKASGKLFEAVSALIERRPRCDLFHSALAVTVPEGRFVVEMTPVPDGRGATRGVVAEGAVGVKVAGRFRIFRYEIRRWRGGIIPDEREASSTASFEIDVDVARRLLDLVGLVPTPVWGRDELKAGEMWNSNSVTSWLLEGAGLNTFEIGPPPGGRAPGWRAGLKVARR